jgi:hypothetical protein
MKIARALVFLVVGVVLPVSAAPKEKNLKPNCTGATCITTVTVDSCKSITVSTEPIVVAKGNKPVLRWKLATAGWSFTEDGIDFKEPGGEFEDKKKESGTSFKYKNKNSKPGEYKYDVVVTDGKQTCRYDPTVVNQ